MSYIDIAIPLLIGLLMIALPGTLIKPESKTYEKQKSSIRKWGYVLMAVALLYALIKVIG